MLITSLFLNSDNQMKVLDLLIQTLVCNIPLVSIGILPVKRVGRLMFMEDKHDAECLLMILVKHELCISVRSDAFEPQGILKATRAIFSSFSFLFLSLSF
jgi:hypothetical protein